MYSSGGTKVSAGATKELGERVADFLRRRHPTKTVANVAADTDLPHSTVAKWLEGASTPNGFAILVLIDAYDAEFLAAIWPRPLGFLSKAARAAAREKLDAEIAALEAKRARL